MSNPIQTFTDIPPAKWARIQAAVLAKTGITIADNVGQASAKGITLSWNYMPNAAGLDISLVKRSFYDPSADVIDSDISQLVAAA